MTEYTTHRHPTSGEIYAVELEDGDIVAAAGPLHSDDPTDEDSLFGWISNVDIDTAQLDADTLAGRVHVEFVTDMPGEPPTLFVKLPSDDGSGDILAQYPIDDPEGDEVNIEEELAKVGLRPFGNPGELNFPRSRWAMGEFSILGVATR